MTDPPKPGQPGSDKQKIDPDLSGPGLAEPSDRAPDNVSSVLFACTMNSVRSPMGEGILKHLARNTLYVESAGVRSGEPDGFMVAVMDEIGIDVAEHTPQTIVDLYDSSFDVVITLSPEAHHQALEMTRTMAVDVVYWPTLDPTVIEGSREQRLDAYRSCRDGLFSKIKAYFGLGGGLTT